MVSLEHNPERAKASNPAHLQPKVYSLDQRQKRPGLASKFRRMSKKPSSPKKRERMYFRDAQGGAFRPLENISVTVQAPNRKETVHAIQRRIILGDDATRSVLTIGSEFAIYHNADMDATLVTVTEPSTNDWQRLKSHMEAEDNEVEVQRAARASRNAGRRTAATPSQGQI